jgi:hypothetical protein
MEIFTRRKMGSFLGRTVGPRHPLTREPFDLPNLQHWPYDRSPRGSHPLKPGSRVLELAGTPSPPRLHPAPRRHLFQPLPPARHCALHLLPLLDYFIPRGARECSKTARLSSSPFRIVSNHRSTRGAPPATVNAKIGYHLRA